MRPAGAGGRVTLASRGAGVAGQGENRPSAASGSAFVRGPVCTLRAEVQVRQEVLRRFDAQPVRERPALGEFADDLHALHRLGFLSVA